MRATNLVFAFLALAAPAASFAQSTSVGDLPALPAPSPAATASQRVGLTDVSISYSSPAQRDRVIWGDLVPWGQLWRAGANAATKLTVSHDFTFGDDAVEAGTYSLFMLPEEGSFTIILNTDSSGRGAYGYNAEENVAEFTVTPVEGPDRERMIYVFADTTNEGTTLTLEWAGLAVPMPIAVDTAAFAQAAIDENLGETWRPHFLAARYTFENGGDLEQAAGWMQTSIGIRGTWWNNWFMAQIQAARGEHDDAREFAETAFELGTGDATWENFFKADAEATVAGWPE
jgi:hypothetical protein